MKDKDIHATTPATDHGHAGPPACVQVRGARQNNLKNVDADVPRDAFVVFTGISGSGKSSLAFGTLYAEAQRRYLESVAPYARRLIDQAGVPEVDTIDGLPPELQRAQRGNTIYILDEPTSGLHPSDADRLMQHLQGLVDAGNTVVVVEHDMRAIRQVDWVIDLGPGAGEDGGRIVASGVPFFVAEAEGSLTAPYLKAAL